ncbi:helix-turn-helix domain-containing protein [Gelidibacter japonicus]|uniref:helix-turn-helix domain-containing protein n=1 Tax=Gelidibacter japonicus TaxID=1962232 RepID=UPI003A8CACDF
MKNIIIEGSSQDEFMAKLCQLFREILTEKNEKPEIDEAHLLSRKEAADFLNICLTTLWSLDKSGELPSRRIKSKVFYLKSDLVNYLNQAA